MGIFIHLDVSHAVTEAEWKKAYEDSLKIITKLNLADWRKISIHDTDVYCLTRSKEREVAQDRFKGWIGDGDYQYLTCCEENCLSAHLDYYDPDGVDPLLVYMEDRFGKGDHKESCYKFWWGKTQGEPQHMTLLTVGVMMQSRLKNKAFVHGDVTRGQCKLATELANDILDEKVELPEQCDLKRLYKRVSCMPMDEVQKIRAINEVYLGEKAIDYGIFMRAHFASADLYQYWHEGFSLYKKITLGYLDLYRRYMAQGYDLRHLCRMTHLEDDQIDEFIEMVMDSEIYIKEKDCDDMLALNTDSGAPYGIGALFAQFAFGGARNKRADRYIPLDEVRTILREEMGERADTDALVDQYLADKKQSDTDILHHNLREMRDEMNQEREEYDMTRVKELLFYEHGDTMTPALKEFMLALRKFHFQLLEKEHVQKALEASLSEKCQLLAERSWELTIRDQDWEKIFDDIENHPDSYKRYVIAAYIDLDDQDIRRAVQAFIINDDLYEDIMSGHLITEKEEAV